MISMLGALSAQVLGGGVPAGGETGLRASGPRRLTYPQILEQLVDLRWLASAPRTGERAFQFSSYDRRSHAGPGQPEEWFANADAGNFLRTEGEGEATEWVLADCDGPGIVTRIWSANPVGELHFHVDGSRVLTTRFEDLCAGDQPPFLAPLCGNHARGWNCYVPMPFQKHLKITATTHGFYYHVNVWRLEDGAQVPSFSPALLEEHAVALEHVSSVLSRPATLYPPAAGASREFRVDLREGAVELLGLSGPGMLRRLAFFDLGALERRSLRGVRLRLSTPEDGTLVDCPIGDFFGAAPDLPQHDGYPIGVAEDGTAWCHFPMPFAGSLRVEAIDEVGSGATLRGEALVEPVDATRFPLRLRAAYRQSFDLPTQPRSDYRVLEAAGRGRFTGCTLSIRNPTRTWWGEGDEHFFVDGEEFPSTFGTGTEDYFGYAWCCPEVFRHPLHNQPRCDGPGNYGYTSVNRFHLLDMVPFQESLVFDLELWHWKECVVDLASVAWWYADAAPRHELTAAIEQRLPRDIEPLVARKVEDAIEGEDLTVLAISGGTRDAQEMWDFGEDWSQAKHLWWHDAAIGDTLDLEWHLAEAGTFRILARFTQAIDYGICQLALDGSDLGPAFDLFHDGVIATEEIELGARTLEAGPHLLRVTITGSNPQAVQKFMFGLDYMRLERAETEQAPR